MEKDLNEYKEYLERQTASGKVASYLVVIKKIGSIVNKVDGFSYVPDDFSSVRNLDLLWRVYVLVNEEQKKLDGGIFKNSTLSKSYWDSRHGFCSAAVRSFLNFRIETYDGEVPNVSVESPIAMANQNPIANFEDFVKKFADAAEAAGLSYDLDLVKRFVCSLLAKPFVVLTGLSGSGKTKLAEAFTKWIAISDTYKIIPVGADWTNNEKLLGFPNALDPNNYIEPDTGVLKLLIDANDNPDVPFFLILDEMNLSYVERYFADFLSAMESSGTIKLYDGKNRTASDGTPIPATIPFPKNLFVIGTMNVDETTHMISPKVLDRAQVVEFRVTADQMKNYLATPRPLDMTKVEGGGVEYAEDYLKLRKGDPTLVAAERTSITDSLNKFFPVLAELGSEFAFRTANEALRFCGFARMANMAVDKVIDAAVMQKLLPKLHGSRRRLALPLEAFWGFCRKDNETATIADVTKKDATKKVEDVAKYPVSAEKIKRLYKAAEANGFASYAEA
ncbi:MAG: McrB family protein [Kiritimatiellia bacterium]